MTNPTYTAPPVPENRMSQVSALCSYGQRPLVMTGLIRQILIQHFADPENIEDPRLRKQFVDFGSGYRESGDGNAQSPILIESVTRWQPNDAEKRPAVLIKRNDWDAHHVVIGDLAGGNACSGAQHYWTLWYGSHTLFALAQDAAECELLAAEVARLLLHYGSEVCRELDLMRFMLTQIGALHQVQEAAEYYAVPVTVAYVAEESWALTPQAPRLKRIDLKASMLFAW